MPVGGRVRLLDVAAEPVVVPLGAGVAVLLDAGATCGSRPAPGCGTGARTRARAPCSPRVVSARPASSSATFTPASASRFAAQPPDAPEPTTITSNWVAGMGRRVPRIARRRASVMRRSEGIHGCEEGAADGGRGRGRPSQILQGLTVLGAGLAMPGGVDAHLMAPARAAAKAKGAAGALAFLDAHQFATVSRLCALIVPGSDTAGADRFIDELLAVAGTKRQRKFLTAFGADRGRGARALPEAVQGPRRAAADRDPHRRVDRPVGPPRLDLGAGHAPRASEGRPDDARQDAARPLRLPEALDRGLVLHVRGGPARARLHREHALRGVPGLYAPRAPVALAGLVRGQAVGAQPDALTPILKSGDVLPARCPDRPGSSVIRTERRMKWVTIS